MTVPLRHEWIPELHFPDPRVYDPGNGEPVWVIGPGLDADTLWYAYHSGYFPWYSYRDETPTWCGPVRRFVIRPEEIHVSHSVRNMINKGWYRVSFDKAFDDVIESCSIGSHNEKVSRIVEEDAWLGPDMIRIYKELHSMGGYGPENSPFRPMSVEVWDDRDGSMVGGLYGVEIGRVFIGESMFSNSPGASKLAMIGLAYRLRELSEPRLIDCQMPTDHLSSMGARFISFDDYLDYLWSNL